MKNKKGELTGEILRLIITVLAIVLILVPLAIYIYKGIKYNKEEELARANLNNLKAFINYIIDILKKEGNIEGKTMTLEKIGDGWILLTSNSSFCNIEEEITKTCICICSNYDMECKKERVCDIVRASITIDQIIYLDKIKNIKIYGTLGEKSNLPILKIEEIK